MSQTIEDGNRSSQSGRASAGGNAKRMMVNLIGSFVILATGVAGFRFLGAPPEVPLNEDAGGELAATLVMAAPVRAWQGQFDVVVDGEAATWRIVSVAAEVSGRVLAKTDSCRSGIYVRKGDLLFEIDSENYRLDRQRLQARCSQVEEELSSTGVEIRNTQDLVRLAQVDLTLQQNQLQRVESLFERGATSEVERDTARGQELTARNALQVQQNQLRTLQQAVKTQEAALRLAEAELARVELDLKRCQIVSPISGRIVADEREEGDFVRSGDQLVQIGDTERMEVRCSIRAEDLAWVWNYSRRLNSPEPQTSAQQNDAATEGLPGNAAGVSADPLGDPRVPCEVIYEAEGVRTVWKGMLDRYDGRGIDRQTRMYPFRVTVAEPREQDVSFLQEQAAPLTPPALLAGLFVSVRIPVDAGVPLFLLPASALRPGGQIWVVRDDRLRIMPIQLLQKTTTGAIVLQPEGDLLESDFVVVSPLATHAEGMQVQIQRFTESESADGQQEMGQ